MVEKYSFFDKERQPFGFFANNFIDNQDGTITDRVTGLIWQKSGSTRSLSRRKASSYLKKLNKDRFAGYADWRLPTIEELASLLVFTKINSLHINPLFYRKQNKCWSVDSLANGYDRSISRRLDYKLFRRSYYAMQAGLVKPETLWKKWYAKDDSNYVRAVRSIK